MALLDSEQWDYGRGSPAAGTPVADVCATQIETDLAVAARHVAEGRMIVAQQRERIARLNAQGVWTGNYDRTLDVFLSTLQILEEHERALRAANAKLKPAPSLS